MTNEEWADLLGRLEVRGDITGSSKSEIEAFERSAGFRLPDSYKSFCQVFGPGTLTEPWSYSIAAPSMAHRGTFHDLFAFNAEVRQFNSEYDTYHGNPRQFERSWYFATDIGTAYYYWDPAEVTDEVRHEYKIFVLHRNWAIYPVASSFSSLILDVCLGSGVPGYRSSEPIEWVFEPAPVWKR